ncbi:hypothetical protein BH10ACI1_BH10ACI1_30300 [soil metagenome]
MKLQETFEKRDKISKNVVRILDFAVRILKNVCKILENVVRIWENVVRIWKNVSRIQNPDDIFQEIGLRISNPDDIFREIGLKISNPETNVKKKAELISLFKDIYISRYSGGPEQPSPCRAGIFVLMIG